MKEKLLYIEIKSGAGDRGSAWIGLAKMSKSGRTVYFNGRALQRAVGGGISGNHFCVETGAEYWISGPKKNGEDRHWAGGGAVLVERRAVEPYLALRGLDQLNAKLHPVTDDIRETDIAKFTKLENQKLDE